MIKEKELREFRPTIKYRDGKDITFQTIQVALQGAANENGISVAFHDDEIKFGGFFGGDVEPCLVLYHPEHENDYFKFCIRLQHQGNYAFVTVYDFGSSTQMGNAGSKDYLKDTLKNGDGWEIAGAIIGSGIRLLSKGTANKKKLEEEEMWYSVISDIFEETIS